MRRVSALQARTMHGRSGQNQHGDRLQSLVVAGLEQHLAAVFLPQSMSSRIKSGSGVWAKMPSRRRKLRASSPSRTRLTRQRMSSSFNAWIVFPSSRLSSTSRISGGQPIGVRLVRSTPQKRTCAFSLPIVLHPATRNNRPNVPIPVSGADQIGECVGVRLRRSPSGTA